MQEFSLFLVLPLTALSLFCVFSFELFTFCFQCLFILSAFLVIGAGLWFYFINQSNKEMIIPAVVLLGFGFSPMLVNSLSFATELIGDNKVSVFS